MGVLPSPCRLSERRQSEKERVDRADETGSDIAICLQENEKPGWDCTTQSLRWFQPKIHFVGKCKATSAKKHVTTNSDV